MPLTSFDGNTKLDISTIDDDEFSCRASGAALMAQGSSTGYQDDACRHAQEGLQRSSAPAKTDADSTGSNTSQTLGGPPAINILLLAPEDLQSWLPENMLVRYGQFCILSLCCSAYELSDMRCPASPEMQDSKEC